MNDIDRIRNIGIIAHIDAGKTSTTEGMLFYSGLTHRIGSIDDGTTVMDYLDEERERGITIISAAAAFPWKDCIFHLIDTPGHIDFTAEVERSLRVMDGAVVIFSAVEGVEAQSEKVWRQASHYRVPKIAFINKLDRVGASFERVLAEIREKFETPVLPLQIPVGIEDTFHALVDLLTMQCIRFEGENNNQLVPCEIPEELRDAAEEKRVEMLEALADECDEIAELYLEGEPLPSELLHAKISELTKANQLVPLMVGSAKNRIGVQPLMDAVSAYLPSPNELEPIPAIHPKKEEAVSIPPNDPSAPFAGLIFKVVASTSADLLYLRIYSGTINKGDKVLNSRTGETVRVKQLLRLYAKSTESIESAGPGDIVGLIGPRNCGTGDTLCAVNKPVAFETIQFPEPVVSVAIEPRMTKDKEKLTEVLELICREDPTLTLNKDEETGQRILSGMGELHLEINQHRLENEFNLSARVGEPRVAYRETFPDTVRKRAVFAKVMGDNELYAEAEIDVFPLPFRGERYTFENALSSSKPLPKALVTAAEKALQNGVRSGGQHGYPLLFVGARLLDLTLDPEKSTEGAVAGAILSALDQAIQENGTVVLEPVMHLEIITPEETLGDITNNLNPRRAVIKQMVSLGNARRVECEAPLSEMFGFGKDLPKLSGGRASFTMEPCGYQQLPKYLADKMFSYL
ncbi:MAG: elongation factor G [Verrucomicrobiota bacterium]